MVGGRLLLRHRRRTGFHACLAAGSRFASSRDRYLADPDRRTVCSEPNPRTRDLARETKFLTSEVRHARCFCPALVHAQPLRLPPAGVPCEAKGGHTPGSESSAPFRVHGVLPGSARGAPEGVRRCLATRISAPRSRSHEQDRGNPIQPPAPKSSPGPQRNVKTGSARRRSCSVGVGGAEGRLRRLAGMADATIKAKTGCTWDRWVFALDHYGADKMSHGEIAALVSTKYKIDGWWAQSVTVGYERIKGCAPSVSAGTGPTRRTSRGPSTCRWHAVRRLGECARAAADGWTGESARFAPPSGRGRFASMARIRASSRSASCRRALEERGRGAAHEAARSRRREPAQTVLVRTLRRARGSPGVLGCKGQLPTTNYQLRRGAGRTAR